MWKLTALLQTYRCILERQWAENAKQRVNGEKKEDARHTRPSCIEIRLQTKTSMTRRGTLKMVTGETFHSTSALSWRPQHFMQSRGVNVNSCGLSVKLQRSWVCRGTDPLSTRFLAAAAAARALLSSVIISLLFDRRQHVIRVTHYVVACSAVSRSVAIKSLDLPTSSLPPLIATKIAYK